MQKTCPEELEWACVFWRICAVGKSIVHVPKFYSETTQPPARKPFIRVVDRVRTPMV